MKIFNQKQLRNWDQYTIENEPISSLDLMERASKKCFKAIIELYPCPNTVFHILCGPGNNVGDGLVIARLLRDEGFEVKVYLLHPEKTNSHENTINLEKVIKKKNIPINKIDAITVLDQIQNGVIVDALYGSGLTRPLEGISAEVVQFLNKLTLPIVSIDVPSGMDLDGIFTTKIIRANVVLTLQQVKYPFLFIDSGKFASNFQIIDIGLSREYEMLEPTTLFYITFETIKSILLHRPKFSNKGTYGTAGLVVGKFQMMGAAILATQACLRSGVGLVKVFIPNCGTDLMQQSCPEAIVVADENPYYLNTVKIDNKVDTIGIGCGIGTEPKTATWLKTILENEGKCLVLDADALNIISEYKWQDLLPKDSVITPHPKEFDRLFGPHKTGVSRNKTQILKSKEHGIYIVLKGAHTSISTPSGDVYFNSTGNAGMAKGGSGDVLTGLITGLKSRGYSVLDACLLGVYLHGKSGDIAAIQNHQECMNASDIIKNLPEAMKHLYD